MDSADKISRELAARARSGGRQVEAVVELRGEEPPAEDLSRGERIAAIKRAFERCAAPVEEAVRRAGGEVVGRAWINGTLHVRLPAAAIGAVAELVEVSYLDAPRPLKPE